MIFSICDVETTGGGVADSRITEIAIYKFDAKENKVVDKFTSLVNPEKGIQPFVQKFTGITDEMVQKAPPFSHLSNKILSFLDKTVFVAHNVSFDYKIVQKEFLRSGIRFSSSRLCTIQCSKKIFPESPSYGLSNIIKHLNIKSTTFHRAENDVIATTALFSILYQKDKEQVLRLIKS